MTWGMVAVGAGTLVSGYMGSEASKDAAESGADAADRAAAGISAAGRDARNDVLGLYDPARQDLLAGSSGAFDMFNRGMEGQQQAMHQGNYNAQNTVSQGFGNVQNALLGLPVNQQAFQPQGIQQYGGIQNPFTQAQGVETIGTHQLPQIAPPSVAGAASAARGGSGMEGHLTDALTGGATNMIRGYKDNGIVGLLSGGLF
jgi:hypothetical protein